MFLFNQGTTGQDGDGGQATPFKAVKERGRKANTEQTITMIPENGSTAGGWSDLPACLPAPWLLDRNRIVTANRSDPAHVAFDILRTRVRQQLIENNWKSILITSPTAGCGKTVVSLNLAFSMANQKDCRTVLVDLDLHRPHIGTLLGATNSPALEDFLNERLGVEHVLKRYGRNIAIACNGRPLNFASELLQSAGAARALRNLTQELVPDVVIFDMPPMLANDDVAAFLPSVDCAILVVAAEQTTLAEVDLCERELAEKTNLLGVVLNKCRYAPEKYGY